MRRGGGPLLALRLRYVRILIKAVLINIFFTRGGCSSHWRYPVGLAVAMMYYEFGAFEELRQYGYGPAGPSVERLNFNMLLRAATWLLAVLPVMIQTSLVGTRMSAERDKKTWETFLTTPLVGTEILWSKARAERASGKGIPSAARLRVDRCVVIVDMVSPVEGTADCLGSADELRKCYPSVHFASKLDRRQGSDWDVTPFCRRVEFSALPGCSA